MEKFEEVAVQSALLKLKCWLRCVDDTFVIWSHREGELLRLLNQLNSAHPRIQCMMEKEADRTQAFLDVLVLRRGDGSLGHRMYCKLTHTDRYLYCD